MMSSSSDSLPIAFRPVTRCRWCIGGSTTSSRRVAQASSSSMGSEPSKALEVLRDLAQMKEAHDYSSVVTSLQLEGLHNRFRVPVEIVLSISGGLCLSVDAVEVGLCLPLPLMVISYMGYLSRLPKW
ncbi:hypothetical protein GW17_00051054 [Ensete ventricosum]|nr:hypothetical protein GW17_00051054 [Ensete ventricosum]